jgi:hypothetical protein
MAAAKSKSTATSSGQIDTYPFALNPGCSDGKAWPDHSFVQGRVRVPAGDKKYQDWQFKLGGLLRDQLFPKQLGSSITPLGCLSANLIDFL